MKKKNQKIKKKKKKKNNNPNLNNTNRSIDIEKKRQYVENIQNCRQTLHHQQKLIYY